MTLLLETGSASVKPRLRRQRAGLGASLPRAGPAARGARAGGYSADGSSLISGRVMTDSSGGSSRG
ncbi:MAG: hypothetical protein ACREJ0_26740, partial [Geminicoccaceae bacterium]